MASPDRPSFDISQNAVIAVSDRLQQAVDTGTIAFEYCVPVIMRMRENHPPLYELVLDCNIGGSDEERYYCNFGATLAYDVITEQLRLDNKTFVVNDTDIDLFYFDLITKGGSKSLTREEHSALVQAGLASYKRGEFPTLNVDLHWLPNLARQHSPRFFGFIDLFVPEESLGIDVEIAFIKGVLPPSIVFYRKLGLIGQPQDPQIES